jgi:AraC family transcriptional activator of mtrCDE
LNQHAPASAPTLLTKFIDSIEVKFKKAEYREIIKPFQFTGAVQNADVFLRFNSGTYFFGTANVKVEAGSFYFIPRGQKVNAGTGSISGIVPHLIESFSDDHVKGEFTGVVKASELPENRNPVISFIAFDTILYNAFPFFPLLDLPAFVIPPEDEFAYLLREICMETELNRMGKAILLKNYLSELVVHLFRFIDSRPALSKSIDKLHYLTDARLIDIVKYVQENLDKDLTNAAIAKVAYVSDDYVGQFFKALTGRTLQDYIESQRLDRAMHLLKTIPNSVQEVACMVGFKDAAYFSRRFRMRFSVNANVIRQGKNQDT